jgi:hypothetical protein
MEEVPREDDLDVIISATQEVAAEYHDEDEILIASEKP